MFQCDDCTELYQDGANVASGDPTDWHSGAASALGITVKKPSIARAKRSAAMPGWAGESVDSLH
jgi:hypothetical protein